MSRAAPALTVLAVVLALAGCGSGERTPAEAAYLAELTERGAQIELADPDRDLDTGRQVCTALAKVKPGEDRDVARYGLQQSPVAGTLIVNAATRHLCPDMAKQ